MLLFWAAANLLRQPHRPRLIAIRDHPWPPTRWASTRPLQDRHVRHQRAYTGVAGALSASAIAFVAPDSFRFELSITFLVGMVVGGIGSLPGAVIGGIF